MYSRLAPGSPFRGAPLRLVLRWFLPNLVEPPHGDGANRFANSPGDSNAHERGAKEFDLHPRAAITKGERSQLFAISYQSQRELALSLEWEAIACIWGGPVLALLSLYVLIVSWT
jgi:hypothetical protein